MMNLSRLIVMVLLMLAPFHLGGCAVARAVALHGAIVNDLPVIAGGTREHVKVSPFVRSFEYGGTSNDPNASADIRSPLSAAETLAWYHEELGRRGWQFAPPSQYYLGDWEQPFGDGRHFYEATRKQFWLGVQVAKEKLSLRFGQDTGEGQNPVILHVSLEADYFWGDDASRMMQTGTLGAPILAFVPPVWTAVAVLLCL